MDWTKPIALTVNGSNAPFRRLVLFFGHYDLRVYMNPTAYIDVGAGSLELIANLVNVPAAIGCIGSIGRFCEAAPTAQILVRGEHIHELPINIGFSGMPLMADHYAEAVLRPLKPVSIGSGVILSAGARVMSGVSVGDGAVVGASAVVTKSVPAYEIHAGVPARRLGERPRSAPWWDFAAAYMLKHKDELQALATKSEGHDYRPSRPRFVLRNENTGAGIDIAGFVRDDEIRPITEAPEGARWYVRQFLESETPAWWADCWAETKSPPG